MPVPYALPDRRAPLRAGGSRPADLRRRLLAQCGLPLCLRGGGCGRGGGLGAGHRTRSGPGTDTSETAAAGLRSGHDRGRRPCQGGIVIAEPVMIASERGEVGLAAGIALLRDGASAMDAVEAAVRIVESNEADHFVGVGGLPNLLGEVELDASIMDGATRRSGAVGAVTGFPHPISIARAVFDLLPQHVLLVGRGAERFADEVGIERGETLTAEALKMWQERLTAAGLAPAHEAPVPGSVSYSREALEAIQSTALRDGAWGTVNVLALD